MTWYLAVTPSKTKVPQGNATTTTPIVASSTQPLSARVIVSTPAAGERVGRSFSISGVAPNTWYFEASFPIQVRDPHDNLIATGHGQAQSDWMVEGLVPFTSSLVITGTYAGPASLILLRDNPSGLPENMDLVTIPIIIK